MPSLARWVLRLSLAALARPARGDDEALPGAEVVTSTGRQAEASLGLPTLWFPIESRISFTDYVGRYVPGASVLDGALRLRGGRGGDTSIFVDGFEIRHLELPLGMLAGAEVATAHLLLPERVGAPLAVREAEAMRVGYRSAEASGG